MKFNIIKIVKSRLAYYAVAAMSMTFISCGDDDSPENLAPTITNQTFTVKEDAAVGSEVGKLRAEDPEGGNLTFSITDGNTGDVFAISGSAGIITVAKALDFETTPSYTLTVRVEDSEENSVTGTVTITVTDVADNNAPTFADASREVAEDASPGDNVGDPVTATDADAGQTLSYAIKSGNTGDVFAIDGNTGQITVAGALDHEDTETYTLTVTATDDGTPAKEADAEVTITVNDVNEAPAFAAVETQSIPVNAPNDTPVVTVMAADEDEGDDNTTLTYEITEGNAGDAFKIDENTGQIAVANTSALGDEGDTFALTVEVEDDEGLTATTTVNITIAAPNLPPTFNTPSGTTWFYVDENAPAADVETNESTPRTTAVLLGATDPEGEMLIYGLTGEGNEDFTIDNTGKITVAKAGGLDFETKETYALEVTVSDGLTTISRTISISVNNLNEPPVFDEGPNIAHSVDENANLTRNVGARISVTDPDSDNNNVQSYNITAGNDAGKFEISNTGQITVAGALDHEDTETYTLTVTVRDFRVGISKVVNTITATVTITVNDVNEAPVFDTPSGTTLFHVDENVPGADVETNELTPRTTDELLGATDPEGEMLTYDLTGDGNDDFAIDDMGQITVAKAGGLDFDTKGNYALEVTVSDGMTTIRRTISISVQENTAPVFTNTAGTTWFRVDENAGNAMVATVDATDDDDDKLTYSLTGDGDDDFAIDSMGKITVAKAGGLDFETKDTYDLEVQVSDGREGMASRTISISVNDLAD
ncbi:MAG: cadherin repeat domain-containing protein [Ekhidna sp.]|nr:cadherin repeat domain-containing protein [Ekhidna sp.]